MVLSLMYRNIIYNRAGCQLNGRAGVGRRSSAGRREVERRKKEKKKKDKRKEKHGSKDPPLQKSERPG